MKVKSLLLTIVAIGTISSVMAAGTQPGNWRWKKVSAPATGGLSSNDVLAGENQPITIQTASDVVALRWQINTASLSSNILKNGYLFLQYLDGGVTTNTVPSTSSNTQAGSARGENEMNYTDKNYFQWFSQTNGWRTIANAGVQFYSQTSEGADGNQVTLSSATNEQNASFVMSPYGTQSNVTDQKIEFSSTSNNYLQISVASYSSGYSGNNVKNYGYGIFTTNNGNTSPLINQVGSNSGVTIAELEFHIKSAYTSNNTPTGILADRFGLRPGHRYFFRLRGYIDDGSSRSGFSSADGRNGQDAKGNPPFPYLDVDPNYIQRTLPVTLTSFNANLNGGKVNLAWATATEIANSGFEILKGINSNNLEQSKFVASKAASNGGNSSTALNYTSTDSFPVNNATNYYQLKQIDLDGNTSYSDKVSVYVTGATTSLTVGPNPAVSVLNVNNLKTGSNLRVISLSGAVVKSQIVNANSVSLDVANLPSGVYIVEVVNLGGIKESHKFVKK